MTSLLWQRHGDKLRQAINAGENEHKINHFYEKWNPLIDVGNAASDVQSTIEDFAEVVDQIEDGEFTSPPVSVLRQKDPITKKTFATHKCRNCDARFSCPSYRMYAFQAGARAAKQMRNILLAQMMICIVMKRLSLLLMFNPFFVIFQRNKPCQKKTVSKNLLFVMKELLDWLKSYQNVSDGKITRISSKSCFLKKVS